MKCGFILVITLSVCAIGLSGCKHDQKVCNRARAAKIELSSVITTFARLVPDPGQLESVCAWYLEGERPRLITFQQRVQVYNKSLSYNGQSDCTRFQYTLSWHHFRYNRYAHGRQNKSSQDCQTWLPGIDSCAAWESNGTDVEILSSSDPKTAIRLEQCKSWGGDGHSYCAIKSTCTETMHGGLMAVFDKDNAKYSAFIETADSVCSNSLSSDEIKDKIAALNGFMGDIDDGLDSAIANSCSGDDLNESPYTGLQQTLKEVVETKKHGVASGDISTDELKRVSGTNSNFGSPKGAAVIPAF